MYVCVVVEGCCYLMKWYVVGGHMMLRFAKWCYDLYSDKVWCWKLHKDVTSCSWMFRVAVGCKLSLYAVTWHQILLSFGLCYWLVVKFIAVCCCMTSVTVVIYIVVLVGVSWGSKLCQTHMFVAVMQWYVVWGHMMLQAAMGCYKL